MKKAVICLFVLVGGTLPVVAATQQTNLSAATNTAPAASTTTQVPASTQPAQQETQPPAAETTPAPSANEQASPVPVVDSAVFETVFVAPTTAVNTPVGQPEQDVKETEEVLSPSAPR
ncbi:MAG: hypothetical protein MJ053_02955 [Elusimicrobiaceae bacterium]|nr:hypothetical protein [Elusimicrobiaceae bacterium]